MGVLGRIIRVHNLQAFEDTYIGSIPIATSGYYQIASEAERQDFADNPKVNEHLWAIPAKIAIDDGSGIDFDPAAGKDWLNFIEITPEVVVAEPFVGGLKTKRIKVYQYSQTFTIPNNVQNATIKNMGSSDVCIAFNKENIRKDYLTLEPKESTKIVNLTSSQRIVKYISDQKNNQLEILMWG